MRLLLIAISLLFFQMIGRSQTYFPPLTGSTWETMDPSELGWCPDSIQKLYDWLEATDSKAFIVLKDGKIVLEKYFGTFTTDSVHAWNSAGKTLTAYAVGIAQHENQLSINDPTALYLGSGWTSLTPTQENAITIRNQLTMTTGLDDGGNLDCTDPACLTFLADPNTRWSYHNAPYTLLDSVIESATGQSLNAFVYQKIGLKIGMNGIYVPIGYNNVFFSKPRNFARFGLLLSQDGFWGTTSVLDDLTYLNEMRNSSQSINPSYGYLTWLNGKNSYMLPSLQISFTGSILPNAPVDVYAALGKDAQILNIVPSQNLIVLRMGGGMGTSLVGSQYNDTIWQYINKFGCTASISEKDKIDFQIYPNPGKGTFHLILPQQSTYPEIYISDLQGRTIPFTQNENELQLERSLPGIYLLTLKFGESYQTKRIEIQ
ncbi:MAG: serine hydrolase [Fluviicola sp.]